MPDPVQMIPPERVATIEARLEATCNRLDSLYQLVERSIEKRGSNAWNIVGTIIAAAGLVTAVLIPAVTGGLMALLFLIRGNSTAIEANKLEAQQHSEMRYQDNQSRIDKLEARLERQIEAEQQRNNRIERELGAVGKTDELLGQGRLRLGPDKPEGEP